jgi:iron complex transport system ATP-binding protein
MSDDAVRVRDGASAVAVPAREMRGLIAADVVLRRQERTILDGISLSLVPGEFCALIGPNGSGKSTLLRLLAGLWVAQEGAVMLDGVRVDRVQRMELARRVSLVPQDTRIDFGYTVEEIVATGRYPHRGRFDRETATDRRSVDEAMRRCDVAHLRRRFVTTLSGGERQRVLIARSLATDAQYLLLDEPTANLDVEHSIGVLDLCRSLADSGRAIVLATHDLTAAASWTHSVAVVSAGRLVANGPCDEVLTPGVVEQVFGVQAELLRTGSGTPVFSFQRRFTTERKGSAVLPPVYR